MKKITLIVVVVAVLAFLVVTYGSFGTTTPRDMPSPVVEDAGMERYVSGGYGFSFAFPERYFFYEERSETVAHDFVFFVEDTEFNRQLISGEISGTEGPVSIRVDVFLGAVAEGDLEGWVRESKYSNFPLATTELSSVTVDGHEGFAYSHDGLYMNDAIVLGDGGTVYMLSVSYLTPEDQIRSDFNELVETFSF